MTTSKRPTSWEKVTLVQQYMLSVEKKHGGDFTMPVLKAKEMADKLPDGDPKKAMINEALKPIMKGLMQP